MATVDDFVSVSITLDTATVSRAAFNTPMVVAYHTNWADRVRSYSASTALTTMVGEGFAVTSQAYRMVQDIVSANPRVARLLIGRRSTWTQITRVTPVTITNLATYSCSVDGTVVTYVADASATLAEICTGLAAAIDALPLVTATGASGTHIDVTTTAAGTLAEIVVHNLDAKLTVQDVTVDGGIAADLALIRAANSTWFLFVLDSNATDEIEEAADWAEANPVLFVAQTSDSDVLANGVGNLGDTLKDLALTKTALVWHEDQTESLAAGLVGEMAPEPPERGVTWEFSTISGVAVDTLSDTESTNLVANNVSHYQEVGGVNILIGGQAAGGQWLDQTTLILWLIARQKEAVYAFLLTKPPYTDRSVAGAISAVDSVLKAAVRAGGIDPGGNGIDPPLVTGPRVADVLLADRVARHLPDIEWSARTSGGMRSVAITGKLSV